MIWGVQSSAALATFPWLPDGWVFLPFVTASVGLGLFCVTSIAELNGCVSDDLKGTISGSYCFFWATGYVLGPVAAG